MSLSHGSSIVRDGLVLHVDAANPKCNPVQNKNLLSNHLWVQGSGAYTNRYYTNNGTTSENERLLSLDPFGNSDIIWQSPGNDAASDGDGGWVTSKIPVDPTKTYRYSVWIRKKDVIGDGRAYLGLYNYNEAFTNIGVYLRTSGSLSTNFYFSALRFDTDMSGLVSVDEWVLFVGHLWPAGSGTGANHTDSGVYNMSGTKIKNTNDCVFVADTAYTAHRSYQYYSTTTNEIQQWWNPRIDLIDGTEPSIAELLNGFNDSKLDLTGTCKIGIKSSVINDQVEYIIPTTEEEIMVDASSLDFTYEQTIMIFLKQSLVSTMNVYDQTYGGFGTITSYADGTFAYFHGTSGYEAQPYNTSGCGFSVQDNEVACITVTRNPSGVIWYKNGEYVTTRTNSYPTAVNYRSHIMIGNGYAGKWAGSIYNVLVYDRALSAAEVKQNFEAFRRRFGI